jgi:hypothetical protein
LRVSQARLGVDAVGQFDPAWVARCREPGRRHREAEERNSPLVAEHFAFALRQTAAELRSGAVGLYGTVAECAARGLTPAVVHPLTIEPLKPRKCLACRETNDHTVAVDVVLEGNDVVEAAVRGEECWVHERDQKSGYSNCLLSEESRDFFSFVLAGWVFVYLTLPFGWRSAAYFHQRRGLVAVGYCRSLGIDANLYVPRAFAPSPFGSADWRVLRARYIDDSTPTCPVSRGRGRAAAELYVFDMVCFHHGGMWQSVAKSSTGWRTAGRSLGLTVDTAKPQRWSIPLDKRTAYVGLVGRIAARLTASGAFVPAELAALAGKTVAFARACAGLRLLLNSVYCVLHGRELTLVAPRGYAWWAGGRGHVPELVPGPLRVPLADDLALLAALVGDATGGRPFVAEDHTAMRWVLATDATLYQGGGVFYEVVVDGGTLVLTAFGGTLPSTLHGVNLLLQPIGVGELAAAVIGLETLEASPGLARRVAGLYLDLKIDNLEVVLLVNTGRIGGVSTLEKIVLAKALFASACRLGVRLRCTHIPTALNLADVPSRAAEHADLRLVAALYARLRRRCPADPEIDWFASRAAHHCRAYVSRYPDRAALGDDAFSFRWDRDPRTGRAAVGYWAAPYPLARQVCEKLLRDRAVGLVVLPLVSAPLPSWRARLERRVRWREVLPVHYAEVRRSGGWVRVRKAPPAEALWVGP